MGLDRLSEVVANVLGEGLVERGGFTGGQNVALGEGDKHRKGLLCDGKFALGRVGGDLHWRCFLRGVGVGGRPCGSIYINDGRSPGKGLAKRKWYGGSFSEGPYLTLGFVICKTSPARI